MRILYFGTERQVLLRTPEPLPIAKYQILLFHLRESRTRNVKVARTMALTPEQHDSNTPTLVASATPPAVVDNKASPKTDDHDDGFHTATTNDNDTNNIHEMSHATKVQKTQDQMNAIAQDIQQSQALTSVLVPLDSCLKAQYIDSNNVYFLLGIDSLSQKYEAMRTTRGDGNCFYRAVWYQLCDVLLRERWRQNEEKEKTSGEEGQRLLTFIKDESMKLATTQGGYEELALEIFYDVMVEFLEKVVKGTMTPEQLHTELTEEGGVSEYCTWYLRALTATWCKANADKFLPYLDEGYVDVAQFCASQIEPVGSEATMVAIVAFAECFGVSVSIEYLDGHPFDPTQGLTKYILGDDETSKLRLTLLYRPGHYDILYPKKSL
jgi:ubiquitin thioesterase protein OTUB1